MRAVVVAILVAGAAGHGVHSGTGTSGSGSGAIVGDANAPVGTDTCSLAKDVSTETCLLPNADDGCGKDDDERGGGCISGYTLQNTGGPSLVTYSTTAPGYEEGMDNTAYCTKACGYLGRAGKNDASNQCMCEATRDELERSLPQKGWAFIGYSVPAMNNLVTKIPDGITSFRLYLYHCTPCPASDVMDHTRPKPTGALIGGITGPFAAIAFLVMVGKEY